jgi:phospholipid/cholesterol/gamma-HCH transport system substrate-binding protein
MRHRVTSALVMLAVIAGAVGAYVATRSDSETYAITAEVTQAPNLFDGGRVMVRGVEVGTITDVEPTPNGVQITMSVRSDVPVPADASLSVIPITVISDRYVQLYPAYESGPVLADGDHIPLDRTTIPAELDDVLTQLKGLLAALEPRPGEDRGPLARLIRDLDEVFDGRSDELAGTIEGSAAVLGNLAASDADITSLIDNLDRLFLTLAARSSELGSVNERFELVAESLLADQADLEGTIENLALLSEEAAGLVQESGDELGKAFGRLATVLDAVLAHQDSLSEGIRWTNAIAQSLGETDSSGRGLYGYTGRQAPPGSPNAKYNYRLERRDTLNCERINLTAQTVFAITPSATEADILQTIQSYIPDSYDDDLEFLFKLLISACVDQFKTADLDAATEDAVQRLVADVGEERVGELLARWLFGGTTS